MKEVDIAQVRIDVGLPDVDNNAGMFVESNGDTEIVHVGSTDWSVVTTNDRLADYIRRRSAILSRVGGPKPLSLQLAGNAEMLEDIVHDELKNAAERAEVDEKFAELAEKVEEAPIVEEGQALDGTTGEMKDQKVGKAPDGVILSTSTEHQTHVISVDGEDIIIEESWHDGSHQCERRLNVRKLTHLMCNITDAEIEEIISRDDEKMDNATPEGDKDVSPEIAGVPETS